MDVQQLVKQAEGDLPYDRANLKPSYVVPVDPLNTPVLQLSVRGIGWDPVRLREFVANDVVRDLKGLEGVQNVYPFGGLQRQGGLAHTLRLSCIDRYSQPILR